MFILTIVAVGYEAPKSESSDGVANAITPQTLSSPNNQAAAPSVDQLIATRVAAGIAERAELPIARNVANLSLTLSVESELAQVDQNVITKPQIIELSTGNRDIRSYTTVAGDTVASLAAQFGLSEDTIKWANGLRTGTVEVGKELQIPRANGVVYTVKEGDTLNSIASKYSANELLIKTHNDLEVSGLVVGQRIFLPDGVLPNTERPDYVAPVQQQANNFSYATTRFGSGFSGSSTWTIGYGTARNGYAAGNCTAYAFNRRVELGKPVGPFWGHAASWASRAMADGLLVNNTPSVGAIMQNGGGYGHVAIVEEILANGDISISEMNAYVPGGGFNIVSGRIVPAGNVSSYNYIH